MKRTLFFFLLILGTLSLFAQEQSESAVEATTTAPQKKHAFFLSAGPMLLVNTDDATNSAPSPIMFGGGGGATLFLDKPVSLQPRATFFTNYYLWDGARAHPAEIENRTALAFSLLVDVDAVKVFRWGKHQVQAGGGVSVLARYGILAGGVHADDTGGMETSTAGDDVDSINDYVWSDMRFLYPNVTVCWLYELPNGWAAGVSANVYIPLGSLANGDGADGLIASLAFRLVF